MPDDTGTKELPRIDYDAAGRMAGRWRWKEDPRAQVQPVEYPFSDSPDPKERVKAQKIMSEDEGIRKEREEISPIAKKFAELEKGKETCAKEKSERGQKRATEVNVRDLKAQEAIVAPDHQIYGVVKRVAQNIGQAEREIVERGGLTRRAASDKHAYYVTKRENVNAYTYPQGEAVFLESGIVVLMDKFLRETKGYGLAEDHLALLQTHEVSHADPEAEKGYLNEEYCDIQGLILGAEAGYNPSAAVDVEDFLIWLDEGSKKEQVPQESARERERENAYIPSHPDPHHRRLVLINALKDETRILPSQTKQFTPVDRETIKDLESQMKDWQGKCQARVLPRSQEEVLAQIERTSNLSEVLDVCQGHYLHHKAELVKAIADDQGFTDRMTLYQAIAVETKARVGDRVGRWVEGQDFLSDDIGSIAQGQRFKGYDSSDLVVGGLAKNLKEIDYTTAREEEMVAQSEEIKSKVRTELDQVQVKVHVKSESGWQASTEEKDLEERKAKMTSFILTDKVRKLHRLVDRLEGKIDVARLLSGDFSEHPALSAALNDLGIEDFSNYLGMIQGNFQKLQVNNQIRSLLSDRVQSLFADPELMGTPLSRANKEYVVSLLEETKYYRMACFADRGMGGDSFNAPVKLIWDEGVGAKIEDKMKEITHGLSSVPQEQELIHELLCGGIRLRNLPDEIEQQIVSSTRMSGTFFLKEVKERYETPGLTQAITDLRIAPTLGGKVISQLVYGGNRYNRRTGFAQVDSVGQFLGDGFDYIKLYYHEGEYYETKNEWGEYRCNYRLKPRDVEINIELLAKRKALIPTFDQEVREFEIEQTLKLIDPELDSTARFEQLKEVAKISGYEASYLSELVTFTGISIEEKTRYLVDSLHAGEFTFHDLETVFKFDEDSLREEIVAREKEKYRVGMSLLKQLPVSSLPQLKGIGRHDLSTLCQRLFEVKLDYAKYDKVLADQQAQAEVGGEVKRYGYRYDLKEVDLFKGLSTEERLKAQLDFIFDFLEEGGVVTLSWDGVWEEESHRTNSAWWAGMENLGASVNLLGVIDGLNHPLDLIEGKVRALLEANKGRYTQAEIDKWISLLAYCQQPGIQKAHLARPHFEEESLLKLKVGDFFLDRDPTNVDHVLQIAEALRELQPCSYRDFCLERLVEFTERAVYYESAKKGKGGSYERYDHPARVFLEKQLMELLSMGFSQRGFGTREDFEKHWQEEIMRNFIPASEQYYGDLAAGFFIEDTAAARVWNRILRQSYKESLRSPLGMEYRNSERFIGLDADTVERVVLYDRLRLIQEMPDSEVKESLALFSLQTAYENLPSLKDPDSFSAELVALAQDFGRRFTTAAARQRLFEMRLRIDLGGFDVPINAETIRARFSTQQEFLDYVTRLIPEKTAFRDPFVLLASETYPLRVGDAAKFRDLLFSIDYGTQEKEVVLQRAGLEIARALKSLEDYKPGYARELILWLVDEDRQIRSIDEFLVKLRRDPVGMRLLAGLMKGVGYESHPDERISLREKAQEIAMKAIIKGFVSLPLPVKRKIISELIQREGTRMRDFAFVTRAGMPDFVHSLSSKISEKTFGIVSAEELTFNSLLDTASLENPTAKAMFFDFMLGNNGLLEEPVERNAETFNQRMGQGFEGSEMHLFVDDLVEMIARKGRLGKNVKRAFRVIGHSVMEGLGPVRRATALHNLLTEIPKIDFSQPDQEELQSQIFRVALSSFGVLGAKLGQVDELIPEGWGSAATSLKHATKPMLNLAVADVFNNEGLSDEYKILKSSGAASTACGYMVENPRGDEQHVKVVRPEVVLSWEEDFGAVGHMINCLQETDLIGFEPGPVLEHLRRLIQEELKTGREIENVISYVSAETEEERKEREGIRAMRMPLERIGPDGNPVPRPPESLMIFSEPLGKAQGYITLAEAMDDPELSTRLDLEQISYDVANDQLYRFLVLGNGHEDPHEGNLMVDKDGIIRSMQYSPEDLVWIDFGQHGTIKEQEKRANAARFLLGLGLADRGEVASAVYEALKDKTGISPESLKKELSLRPKQLEKAVKRLIAKYDVEEYLVGFSKAAVNLLPYIRRLPRKTQFDLITPYMPADMREKLRTRLIAKAIEGMG